jgi:chromosome segregation ATPase
VSPPAQGQTAAHYGRCPPPRRPHATPSFAPVMSRSCGAGATTSAAGAMAPSAAEASSSAALQAALAAEEVLSQQEQQLLARAAALERQVQEHNAQKEAIREARRSAEEQRAAEVALEKWQAELRRETDVAIERLNEQRAKQLSRCHQFERQLQANIEQMVEMQAQVQRRAVALDSAFDACVSRLSGAYADAVARRRGQQATAAELAMSSAAARA